jgi:hypothetical protein
VNHCAAFLDSVHACLPPLQIHAERLDCAVGSLQFEVHIMLEGGEEVAQEAAQLTTAEMDVTLVGGSPARTRPCVQHLLLQFSANNMQLYQGDAGLATCVHSLLGTGRA